jgi:hypothetical protein
MPRTRLGDKVAAMKADDQARAAQIANLPADVRQALASMTEEDRDNYLRSLDRVDEMAAKGETLPPPAPYGLTKDGTARQKPGRKPDTKPGKRTKIKVEGADPNLPIPELRQQEREIIKQKSKEAMEALEAELGDFPEDAPEAAVQFGRLYLNDPAAEPATKAPTIEEREAQERAAREAEFAEAFERAGISMTNVVAGSFQAVQMRPTGDPDELETYTVERVSCELRVLDLGKDYELQVRFGDGAWESVAGPHREPSGASAVMARRRIRPVDSDAFGLALARLPSPHPARQFKVTLGAGEGVPKTPKEREERNKEIREQMAKQRQSNALHRGCYADVEP